ncbi:unnamed protein product [Nippostrongylus brasiliensis]|uniref:PB1 domain-containing protein n=1 Tax=Nippostrongylus brasiliensis TaxID=27835 RepID=A0A0N4XWT1_NIPBR|nr:unnamed protein product [Nippostrongylus brasiliensis]
MPDSSSSEPKSVTFKLYLEETPRITITYKDEDDLFKQFNKAMEEFGAALHDTYWVDDDQDLATMSTPKIVHKAAQSQFRSSIYIRDGRSSDNDGCCRRQWPRHHSPSRDLDNRHFSDRHCRDRCERSQCGCHC